MNIVLFTTHNFLINEVKKTSNTQELIVVKEKDKIYNVLESNDLLIYHLDSDENFLENASEILKNYMGIKLIALRNSPNNIEGCSLLKKGFKAYAHSISNSLIIEDIIKVVSLNKIWVYPELMQFLISSVPFENKNEKALFDKLSIKELEVLELVAQGLNNSKIAKTLDVAEVTVKKHISSLFKKLDIKDRLSLALFYKNNI